MGGKIISRIRLTSAKDLVGVEAEIGNKEKGQGTRDKGQGIRDKG